MNQPIGPITVEVLKTDLFGEVHRCRGDEGDLVVRDLGRARWWCRPVARMLARREARALEALRGIDRVPRLVSFEGDRLVRSYVAGVPMQRGRPTSPAYYRAARRLIVRLHRAGVVHNDLAKEPNWLVAEDGKPALVDFQLASRFARRGRRFRLMAREDLRHLLKHKRTYCAAHLTSRERRILATPSAAARVWRATGKRVYLWVTRGLFRWQDREGAGDRHFAAPEAEEGNRAGPPYTAPAGDPARRSIEEV